VRVDALPRRSRSVLWFAALLGAESLFFGFLGSTACALNAISENGPDRQHSIACQTIGAGPSSVVWWLVLVAPVLILLCLTRVLSVDRDVLRTVAAVIAVCAVVTYLVLFAL
jgi:hypothetical protein